MKREKRQPYLALCDELFQQRPEKWVKEDIIVNLCSLCRNRDSDDYVFCDHPVERIRDMHSYRMEGGDRDCWAFQARGKVDVLRQKWLDRFATIQAGTDDAEWERQQAQEAQHED